MTLTLNEIAKFKGREIFFLGLGVFGASVLSEMSHCEQFTDKTIAIDYRRTVLGNSHAQEKIQIKKDADAFAEARRIESRIIAKLGNDSIVFLMADMYEPKIGQFARTIARVINRTDALIVGVVLYPYRAKCRDELANRAIHCLQLLRDEIAVVAIPLGITYNYEVCAQTEDDPFDSIGNYDKLEYWCAVPGGDEIQLKQKVIGKEIRGKTVISSVQMAFCCISKIIKMLRQNYINTDAEDIVDVLKFPGLLHIASAHNSIWDRFSRTPTTRSYILERKLVISRALDTDVSGTESLLIHLNVPPNLENHELEYLCERIPGRSGANRVELAITVDRALGDTIEAEVIATGAFTREEWEFEW